MFSSIARFAILGIIAFLVGRRMIDNWKAWISGD
jgi:hypothetical protein